MPKLDFVKTVHRWKQLNLLHNFSLPRECIKLLSCMPTFYQIDEIEVIKHGNAKKHILYIHGF